MARTKGHGYGRGSGPPRPRGGRGLVSSVLRSLLPTTQFAVCYDSPDTHLTHDELVTVLHVLTLPPLAFSLIGGCNPNGDGILVHRES